MNIETWMETLLIAKGNHRLCCIHPDDPDKVIKIPYKDLSLQDQNEIDATYYKYLLKMGVSFSHVARCHGWIELGETRGLVFDRVTNADNSPVRTLTEVLTHKELHGDEVMRLLDDLRGYLEKNTIVFADASLKNIVCQKLEGGSHKLIIIDGLGARRKGLKFWLYRHFKPYARYKLRRQWKIVMHSVNERL